MFFTRYGFSADRWPLLAEAIRLHAAENDISKTEQTSFGTRFVVEGLLQAADGRTPNVRSVWFVEQGETVPRFVTAYPLPKDHRAG